MKDLLIIGAIPDEKHKMRYGGATVLMKNFLDYLNTNKVEYGFVQTNKFSNLKTGEKRPLLNKLYFIVRFIVMLPFYRKIMFNFSDNGVTSIFPSLSKLCKVLGKKVILRKFGGSFDIYISKISDKKKAKAIEALSACDLVLFETKKGIEHLKTLVLSDVRIEWFPNNRLSSSIIKDAEKPGNRLVFISQISDEKGVGDLLSAAKKLTLDYEIHLFGYIGEEKYRNFDWGKYGVTYHGEISSDKVNEELVNSLLLLLTSYREGYPGIIIEAFSAGVPVVASDVGGIPEMMTDGIEGRMVTPGDIEGIVAAIQSFDLSNYKQYSANALKKFNSDFESGTVNARILNCINSI